ncbi:MAG TPA: hypothetical protein VGR37_03155, partial [Longimicrobiaceae bacterium]|nr:hypothetical protein [Longimicrobiaceae bacterium]
AALARGVTVRVGVDLATGAVVAEAGGEGRDTLWRDTLPLAPGGRLAGGREGWAEAVFGAAGRARADRVLITDEGGRYEVRVDPWTGDAEARRF